MAEVSFENYEAHKTNHEETGLRLFSLKDPATGVKGTFVEFNDRFDVHAGIAYIGAKTSRSIDETTEIFGDVIRASNGRENFSGEKLASIFTGYGHASVADMAPVMLFFDELPMHLAYQLFNATSVGGGQELSTRYVKLEDFGLPTFAQILGREPEGALEAKDAHEWIVIQGELARLYRKWYDKLHPALDDFLRKNGSTDHKPSTVDSRTLDVARMFIPFGTVTRQAYLTSARNWIDIAVQLRSSDNPQSILFGEQIVALLSLSGHPELGDIQAHLEGLTKYNEGSDRIDGKLLEIRRLIDEYGQPQPNYHNGTLAQPSYISEFMIQDGDGPRTMREGEILLASYIASAMPFSTIFEVEKHTSTLLEHVGAKALSHIIFEGHTRHDLMRSQADVRGIPIWYESALAFHRDINRQRAFGRNALMFSGNHAVDLLHTGFNENFAMSNADYWQGMLSEWERDMFDLYNRILSFVHSVGSRYSDLVAQQVAINIMPLGNQATMILSAPPSQWNYMTDLRVALGGDFGYREDVWNMLEIVRNRDPLYSAMASHLERPDVNSVAQIVGRS